MLVFALWWVVVRLFYCSLGVLTFRGWAPVALAASQGIVGDGVRGRACWNGWRCGCCGRARVSSLVGRVVRALSPFFLSVGYEDRGV